MCILSPLKSWNLFKINWSFWNFIFEIDFVGKKHGVVDRISRGDLEVKTIMVVYLKPWSRYEHHVYISLLDSLFRKKENFWDFSTDYRVQSHTKLWTLSDNIIHRTWMIGILFITFSVIFCEFLLEDQPTFQGWEQLAIYLFDDYKLN